MTTTDLSTLCAHISFSHENDGQKLVDIICPLCHKLSSTLELFKEHIYEKHLTSDVYQKTYFRHSDDSEASASDSLSCRKDGKRRRMNCEICDVTIAGGRVEYEEHITSEHGSRTPPETLHYDCPLCVMTFSSYESLYNHTKLHKEDYALDFYNKLEQPVPTLTSPSKINATLNPAVLYPPHGPYNCPFCDKGNFSSGDVLEIHLHTMHGTSVGCPLYICTLCSAVLPSEFSLQSHISSTHPDRNVIADKSGNPTPSGHSKPTDNGLVFCPRCSVGFQSQYMLAEHVRTVHKSTQKKSQTNTSLYNGSSSSSHQTSPRDDTEPLKCTKCSLIFTEASSLQVRYIQETNLFLSADVLYN